MQVKYAPYLAETNLRYRQFQNEYIGEFYANLF